MREYNYKNEVIKDMKDYLLMNYDSQKITYSEPEQYSKVYNSYEDFKELVALDMRDNDDITGNRFGYDMDDYFIKKIVLNNWDLLMLAIENLDFYFEEDDYSWLYTEIFENHNFSQLDSYIREYYVDILGEQIIDELYNNGEIDYYSTDGHNNISTDVDIDDEEYDEGFKESLNTKHKKRIKF